ncbi:MAG: bifunctional 5,10-methylenetetrahydrofolate dehydrogenase/5,10-methenyltetrahydrofolate cyclohydrolase [bacterium]|nr:bifunctional 5,10-methylenetetrahydrofolate dehydrogenase/5,10-methenyltetrahydrofolate cyclohydrolase [bacterium]
MKILSGEAIAERILGSLKAEGLRLSVIQVGDNPVSGVYIEKKRAAAERLKIHFELFRFPEIIAEEELCFEVEKIQEGTDGLIIQLPLPKHLAQQRVLDTISLKKDIDVLSSVSFEKFIQGEFPVLPPTVCAVSELLREAGCELRGKKAVVVGHGRLVGRPVSVWLSNQGAEVSVVTEETENPSSITREADILISGVGKQGLITKDMVKKGAVVIDAGSSVEGGETRGDVADEVKEVAGMLAPVPGGVGPLTVACLLRNLVILSAWE